VTELVVDIDLTVDGQPIPGFPYHELINCRAVYAYTKREVNTTVYVDVLTGIEPVGTYTVRFIFILPSLAANFAVLDDVTPIDPLIITADQPFIMANISARSTTAVPAFLVKANTAPTDFFIVVGIE
jgi:hypothetical protein